MDQQRSKSAQNPDPIFVSLGLFVLDELRFPSRATLFDVPGGSGIYGTPSSLIISAQTNLPATLGARLLKSSPYSAAVGCIVLAGQDFPQTVLHMLRGWDMNLQVCKMPKSPTTRGLLVYEDEAFGRK